MLEFLVGIAVVLMLIVGLGLHRRLSPGLSISANGVHCDGGASPPSATPRCRPLLLVLSIWTVRDVFVATFADTALMAILFTVGALLPGSAIARAIPANDRPVVGIETTVRNIPAALTAHAYICL